MVNSSLIFGKGDKLYAVSAKRILYLMRKIQKRLLKLICQIPLLSSQKEKKDYHCFKLQKSFCYHKGWTWIYSRR